MRIGLDNVYGYITRIDDLGVELQKTPILSLKEFKNCVNNNGFLILDVRGEAEYEAGHVTSAMNLFVGTLQDHLDKINRDKEIVVHCQSGDRSAIACSVLKKNGFSKVRNYLGGMKEWQGNKEEINCAPNVLQHA